MDYDTGVLSILKTIANKKKAEAVFVTCVFVFVFGYFCIPIIIYATSSDVTELGIDFDIVSCVQEVSYIYSHCHLYISCVSTECYPVSMEVQSN